MVSKIPFKVRKQLYLSGEPAVRGSIMHKGVESKGNICECLIQMLRVQKLGEQDCISYDLEVYQRVMELHRKQKTCYMWLLTLYGTWISWATQLIMKCQHQKWDTLAYEFWLTLLLPNVMRMLQMRKTYFPYKEIFTIIEMHLFFQTTISNPPELFSFLCPSGDCHLHTYFFIIWGNNRFHMVREWNYLIGLLWHMWQIVPSPLVTEWVILE